MPSASLVIALSAVGKALAVDGIADAIALWLGTHRPPVVHVGGRVVALRAGREWRVGLHEWVIDFWDGGPPHATVSGTASDLTLWLWGQMGDDVLHVEAAVDVARVARCDGRGVGLRRAGMA